VIGDAYNIYPDAAGLKKFLRHVIYLKPDIFIIIDELETKAPSTFDWFLHYEGTLEKTTEKAFTLMNGDVNLKIDVILPHEFDYMIYQQTAARSEGARKKILPTLKLSPKQKVEQAIFLVVLHPAKIGELHPTVTEIEENGKMGLLIKDEDKVWRILFDFTRPERNSRIFELISEPEPTEVFYNFTRELPPPESR